MHPPSPVTLEAPCRMSEIPEAGMPAACSATSTEGVEAILDTGASRCVIGDQLLKQFMCQLPPSIRSQVRESPSAVKFRFGNNGTLTSAKRVYLPLQSACGQPLWLGIEVVPGNTIPVLEKGVEATAGNAVHSFRHMLVSSPWSSTQFDDQLIRVVYDRRSQPLHV